MSKTQETLQLRSDGNTTVRCLYMAMELSEGTWRLAFSDGRRQRQVRIPSRDLIELWVAVAKAKKKFGLEEQARVLSCYEAGRDAFWIHRYLEEEGIENVVVDSASIEVNRRKRRAKTDRLDAEKLLQMLMRYHGGETRVWSVVRVPSVADEDARHLHRELETLKSERTRHRNRIRGFLAQQGVVVKNPGHGKFLEELEGLRIWSGQRFPAELKQRIRREYERMMLVEEQIKGLEKVQVERVKAPETVSEQKVAQLQQLYGIGSVSSWTFVMELFGWRQFRNRREVGAFAGLTPTPYDSGEDCREQGISKAGSGRIRSLTVEVAWAWLRYQPQSKLSQWFMQRFGHGGKRMRRIGIVALARKLLIDLWRYLEQGVIPEGAIVR